VSVVVSEQQSPVQAATFVATELREDSQLRAVSTVLEAWTGADPIAALSWVENVAATWLIRAPAEARHWIEQSWLPAESKARFSGIGGSP
jgi:hypothetical protein